MYAIQYLKNIKQSKTTKYTDNNSDRYSVEKRKTFLSQKKKFCEVRTVALSHIERKNISMHLRIGAGDVAITADC